MNLRGENIVKLEANLLLSYWNSSEGIITFSKVDEDFLVSEFLKDGGLNFFNFEKPDIIVRLTDKDILLEHFSFDSSLRIDKGGSLMKIEENKIDKKFKSSINQKHAEGEKQVLVSSSFKTPKSLKCYTENLIASFKDHYGKINDYISNFKKKVHDAKDETELGFFIECTSILPEVVVKGTTQKILTPFHIVEFLELLKSSPKIKHIFIPIRLNHGKTQLYYFSNSDINLEIFRKDIIDSSYRYIDFNTNEIHVSVLLE